MRLPGTLTSCLAYRRQLTPLQIVTRLRRRSTQSPNVRPDQSRRNRRRRSDQRCKCARFALFVISTLYGYFRDMLYLVGESLSRRARASTAIACPSPESLALSDRADRCQPLLYTALLPHAHSLSRAPLPRQTYFFRALLCSLLLASTRIACRRSRWPTLRTRRPRRRL